MRKSHLNNYFIFMKKSFFLGFAALPLLAMLASSCNQEVVESKNDKNSQIIFSAAVGKQTLSRATEFTGWTTGGSFTVKAYLTGTNTEFNAPGFALTFDGTNWNYGSPVLQPGYSLTYYAYYPMANTSGYTVNTSGTASFNYAVQAVATQEDLIAATATSSSATINLAFNHLLSQVNFAVQGITNVKITISNISINGVKNGGSYTYVSGWSALSGSATYAYTPTGGLPTTGTDGNIVYLGNGGGTYTSNNALMLMPQAFSAAADGNFSFDYELKDMADVVLKTGTAFANFCDFTSATWQMGKRYVYLVDFTYLLQGGPIVFTVTVNNWVDDATIAQPILVSAASQLALEAAISAHNTAKGANSALTVFPISFDNAATLGSAITITAFTDSNFVSGDQIRIKCSVGVPVANVLCSVVGWTRTVSGDVVILTKD